jgi:glycosyltransferase involved in cell wall biosynthesis
VNNPTIAHIIPTLGRETLRNTLASIVEWWGDEVIVVQHNRAPSDRYWGNPERNEGMERAKADYLTFIDDDDVYVPGHRELMARAIAEAPDRPILFKVRFPSGRELWRKRWVKCGNVSGQMILVPNRKEMFYTDDGLGYWNVQHSWADFLLINRWRWPVRMIAWREEVIQYLGHDDEKHEQHQKGFSLSDLREAQRARWQTG